jgi:uncharacterized membrane protein YfcA
MQSQALVAALLVLSVSIIMTMTGRGGGNFYVPILIICGLPMLQAATTSQFILLVTSLTATLLFAKNRRIDWKLALVIDPPTDVMALFGGYYAHLVPIGMLKIIFSALLVLAGIFMLRPVKGREIKETKRLGFWHRKFGDDEYTVNLWLTMPITAAAGVVAGMTGISCGAFKVPLMALVCGVPMQVAVGTSAAMVATTALMGLVGHAAAGDFTMALAVPVGIAAVAGGIAGASVSLKTKAETLKKVFAYTTFAAALFMLANAWLSKG